MTDDDRHETPFSLMSLADKRREPCEPLVDLLRELLVDARSGEIRAISVQVIRVDEDGERSGQHTISIADELEVRDILDAMEQHVFSMRWDRQQGIYTTDRDTPEQGEVEGDPEKPDEDS